MSSSDPHRPASHDAGGAIPGWLGPPGWPALPAEVQCRVEVWPNDTFAAAVSDEWQSLLRRNPAMRMVLPSGLTPQSVYRDLIRQGVSLAEATVILLDEFGGLAPDDPTRCELMLRRDFLDHIDLRADHFHRIDIDAPRNDLDDVCADHAAMVGTGVDLALLGIGTNGHVGMNEPGSHPEAPTRIVQLADSTSAAAASYGGSQPPTWGITTGMAELRSAQELWVLATGSRKAEIVQRALVEPASTDLPASWVLRHPRAVLWLDEDAAALTGLSPTS